jgi:hypothetical protein
MRWLAGSRDYKQYRTPAPNCQGQNIQYMSTLRGSVLRQKGMRIISHLILLVVILIVARLLLGRERFNSPIRQVLAFCVKALAVLIVILYVLSSRSFGCYRLMSPLYRRYIRATHGKVIA